MKTIPVTRRRLVDMDFLMKPALDSHASRLIDETCLVTLDGSPLIAYVNVPDDLSPVLKALKEIRYEQSFRSGGLPTNSRIFGYNPRSALRKDFCSSTSLAHEHGAQHAEVCDAGKIASHYYEKFNPDLFLKHKALSDEKVLPQYQLPGTPFTSGIINKNNQLRYHRDTGNFNDVWSAMFVFKKNVSGGHLVVPEIDCTFTLRDKSLFLFDGQGLIHGVTPIEFKGLNAYRYTVVYYSLKQIWNCKPIDEEIKRIRQLKTQRERKRAGTLA